MSDNYRAVVIGAGMIGLNAAIGLAQRGVMTTTVDIAQSPMAGSSGRGGSSLGLVDKPPGPLRELAAASIDLFRRRQAEFGGDWLHMVGGLIPVRPDEAARAQMLLESVDGLAWLGWDEVVLATDLLSQGSVIGALYVDGEGRIDVGGFAAAAVRSLVASGNWGYVASPVLSVNERGSTVHVTLGNVASLECDCVIYALGYDELGLSAALPAAYRVTPCRGLILVCGAPWVHGRDPIMLGLPYVEARYSGLGATGAVVDAEVTFSLEAPRGAVRIGSSREYVGFDEVDVAVTAQRVREEADTYLKVPRDQTVTACWRPVTISGTPIAGRMPEFQNAYCCTGFEGHGVCLSAAVGDAIANYVVTGVCPSPISHLDPSGSREWS